MDEVKATEAEPIENEARAEAVNDFNEEVVKAYEDLIGLDYVNNYKDLAEAYVGEFKSDEDFAQDLAEQVGSINNNATWPYTCIDWEKASREIMYDYSEQDGHYFRNL